MGNTIRPEPGGGGAVKTPAPRGRRPKVLTETGRPILRDVLAPAAVKSAKRAMEIFEYFHDYQRPATVLEISKALGYPQSSTTVLLKSLVNLGYIHHDPVERTYIISTRVSLLSAWMPNNVTMPGKVMQIMQAVRERTGATVVLIGRNGIFAQFLHIFHGEDPKVPRYATGFLHPLTSSGAGYAAIAHMKDDQIAMLARRINMEVEGKARTIDPKTVLAEVQKVRDKGYSEFRHPDAPVEAVHVALKPPLTQEFLAIGLIYARGRMPQPPAQMAQIILDAIAAA